MKVKNIIIKTTYPNKHEALNLVNLLLENKLASCVQIKQIESFYCYERELCKEREFEINIKTRKKLFKQIKKLIQKIHPYETPQIIALKIKSMNGSYLRWHLDSIN